MILVAMGVLVSCAAAVPHVLLAVIDDFGWSNAGWHGNPEAQTPFLDELSSQGWMAEFMKLM